jgi:hypothetical protein
MDKPTASVHELFLKVFEELAAIKKLLQEAPMGEWIKEKSAMAYLDYGRSQWTRILESGEITISRIGRRTLVNLPSLLQFIAKNIITK